MPQIGGRSSTGGPPPAPTAMTDEERALQIRALIREREGYEARGLGDRAELVNAELRRLGSQAAPPQKRAEKRPIAEVETR